VKKVVSYHSSRQKIEKFLDELYDRMSNMNFFDTSPMKIEEEVNSIQQRLSYIIGLMGRHDEPTNVTEAKKKKHKPGYGDRR
jgi:hypothetical protein